ncbi:MAG: hypothetical protein ABJF11_15800 [Reichenbachiella sp.]|uniref:hypothetical protein n=1 Tax=Reichenbachiella sp. TaxID=2184521 RepID=UPI0032646C12
MKKKLQFSQVINIIGWTNLFSILIINESISPLIFDFSIKFSGAIITVSLFFIIKFSHSFSKSIMDDNEVLSSTFAPFFRFVMPNFMISFILSLLIVGAIVQTELIRVSVVMMIITIFPLIALLRSKHVTISENTVKIFDYTAKDNNIVEKSQLVKVRKVLPFLLYKIVYLNNEGKRKSDFFMPKGVFFSFGKPSSIKKIENYLS